MCRLSVSRHNSKVINCSCAKYKTVTFENGPWTVPSKQNYEIKEWDPPTPPCPLHSTVDDAYQNVRYFLAPQLTQKNCGFVAKCIETNFQFDEGAAVGLLDYC